ncbi:glycoside hydrolase family 3 protein [Stachybotrys elegans]|uniref:Beta-glucosidase cel3A n=1 Tax=Stachybotrys elegans TaxID=80388 RepID=A0A8K0SQI2_9HYPO|nr:glycoside hydrolase family 3 protein [Stachybotrys elegans]
MSGIRNAYLEVSNCIIYFLSIDANIAAASSSSSSSSSSTRTSTSATSAVTTSATRSASTSSTSTSTSTSTGGGSVPTNSPWTAALAKARTALGRLSASEKVGIVSGVGWHDGNCVGNVSPVSSIGFPSLCLQDGPLGVRYASSVTAFTPGVQAASTWDRDLIRQRGQFMGEEARGTGVNVLLGPVAGALGKIAEGGRNWEGFSPDPYLTGICMADTIEALQAAGVQANAKHYILNEQELNRETMSSNVDDRTMHELYLWPYADAVRANVASVMCSYNKVNGTWACENEGAMNRLLKTELGFPGYILTDWNAQHTTVESANTGLDMSMPGTDYNGGNRLWGPALTSAISSGRVSQSRVDDMVVRILAGWYLVGQDSNYPRVNFAANVQANHRDNVRAVARDGIVLLKNDDNILPLRRPSTLAVVGSGAVIGDHARNQCSDHGCNSGALGMGWGSGTVNYPYFVAPYDAIRTRASSDGTTVTLSGTDDTNSGANAARGKDIALVFITADSGEGYLTVENNVGDRINLDPWHNGNDLVAAVAGANSNVVVVVHSVGAIILERILALPNVKAIVWAGLPSQESGNALVDVLYGDTNPSGKLVYTIARSASDYNAKVSRGDDNYSEGLFIDYRHFDNAGITPRYEFGFGLSYTTFSYSDISVTSTARSGPATGPIVPGGRQDLFDTVATVTARITNSGSVAGAEVAQLYVTYPSGAPSTPPRQLRGFDKIRLAAGASGTVTFDIRRRDLSYWDVRSQRWVVPAGTFQVVVGASSRDIKLRGSITVA